MEEVSHPCRTLPYSPQGAAPEVSVCVCGGWGIFIAGPLPLLLSADHKLNYAIPTHLYSG